MPDKNESVALNYKETSPVGSTVLRPLLYKNGSFNREKKRTRVEVLPPIGKYSVYAKHKKGSIGDRTLIYVGTDSGYLIPLYVDRTNFEEQFCEMQIDQLFENASEKLDDILDNPERWASYDMAAITRRFVETEQHNTVYKEIKSEKNRKSHEEKLTESRNLYIEQLKTNADIIASGGNFKIGKMYYCGGNNLLKLFKMYGIAVPFATKGWFNRKLISFKAISDSNFSYTIYQRAGGRNSSMSDIARKKLIELRAAIKAVPIEELLTQIGIINYQREYELLYGNENRFGIYQIRNDIDAVRNIHFIGLQEIGKLGYFPNKENYELVYTAPFEESVEFLADRYCALNRVFHDFNIDKPSDYTGRSVSVSDVIVLNCNGDISSHYVDGIGFVEIDGFFGETKTK